ncbi:hypothetical protein ABZ319_31420 [Nocardia sp. NPDC005978]|uniref:hypothetical protein n=1 Tax=Nocardia sp. NPDC005978 TaxID=3156725 RepID=UPI0033A4A9F2
MAIFTTDWLITSDAAHEVAYRIDVPEPGRGRWVLSYLPSSFRVTREQALAGIVLAELILAGLFCPGRELEWDAAGLHARVLGITVPEAMCLLALRGPGREIWDARKPEGRCVSRPASRRRRGVEEVGR